jgi:molecular chaperone DnaK (HSP70)
MARLGVDFGTTNTVAVVADRGHYPVVLHRVSTAAGDVVEEVFPSVMWVDRSREEWCFGLEAERRARRGSDDGAQAHIRSLKRNLRYFADGQTLDLGVGSPVAVEQILVRFFESLKESILRSGMVTDGERLECIVAWPANSNGAQRYITRKAFRAAGFEVIGSVNEPSASAVEYADRLARGNRAQARTIRTSIAIFDIGGGTFDTSLVTIDGGDFHVVDSTGIERLGGDDFDEVLLNMFLEPLKVDPAELDRLRYSALLRHARIEKEGISRDPERGFLELVPSDYGMEVKGHRHRSVRVPVAAYYEALRPMVFRAAAEMERILSGEEARKAALGPDRIEAIYLVGGSSRLPLVPLVLKERFPSTRIIASDKPFTSVAMGAAIVAAERARVSDIISRHFGVIRLRDSGRREYFSPIFSSGTRLPSREGPPLELQVDYSPRHNIGYLQYLECSKLDEEEKPQGEVRRWNEILFPYDPAIPPEKPLSPAEVVPTDVLKGTSVVEHYSCDADGVITVKLERRADGRERTFEISKD